MLGMLFLQQFPVGAFSKTTPGLGAITGRVEALTTMGLARDLQVVLLSPQWADLWYGEVQKRLDIYFDRYRQFLESRTDFSEQVSGLAQRDAISFVINSMQRDLGEEFQKSIKKVSPDGSFEFNEVPPGNYRVIVLGVIGERILIWSEKLHVRGQIPQFIEVRNRIQ